MPSGYNGELGVKGDRGECSTSGGGGLPFAPAADRRGEWGGGGALRGGRVKTWIESQSVLQTLGVLYTERRGEV